MAYRSLLFVPATRPERFEKALASGADAVCLDLEDAVPPEGKAQAREAAAAFLAAGRAGVRINTGEEGMRDLEALQAAQPLFVMIPKVADPDDVREARGHTAAPLWPLIESAEALRNAWDIAGSGIAGVLFGGADYAADLGCDMGWDALAYARGRLAAACARAGVQLLDVPYLDVGDEAGLAAETARVKGMGFTGRSCIHPAQVGAVNAVFTPTAGEIAKARRILAALDEAKGAAALLDGKLIERPVANAARRILERAGGA